MKKWFAAVLINLCFFASAWSQIPQLMVQGETGKLYLEHIVEAGQNWYSVGRMYNISPKEIAPFNSESLDKPLVIGEQLKIPLTSLNFSQDGIKAGGEALLPIYHIIQEREWLYRISTNYNHVPVENLEKWNHINKDQAKKGMELVVGYLKVKTGQSSLAKEAVNPDKIAGRPVDRVNKDENSPINNNLSKPESKPVSNSLVISENKQVNSYSGNHPMGGYFRSDFNAGNGSGNGQAGIFKSTSGWQDGKYYALMNNIQVGTIVKVSSSITHKSIYAKVLGQLPDMKESTGLIIRISNAAASELGIEEPKFSVELKY